MLSSIFTLILISLSLAMDAFSVSIIDGLTLNNLNKKRMVFICLIFGIFQALLPLLGHLIGLTFIEYIEDYDHWISLALLSLVGLKMIIDAIKEIIDKKKGKDKEDKQKSFTFKLIIIQGIATAIDAFAVGITLKSSIAPINVYLGLFIIGLITFLMCLIGIFLGKYIAKFLKGHIEIAEIIGGIILILIGIKIVLNHLGYISF